MDPRRRKVFIGIDVSKKKSIRIDTSGTNSSFGHSAFSSLEMGVPLPQGPTRIETNAEVPGKTKLRKSMGGRLDVKREKSGRAGKTVTVIYAFAGMDDRMRKTILLLLKKQLATGGTITNGNIEIQGDFADRIVEILLKEGYRAIRAGG